MKEDKTSENMQIIVATLRFDAQQRADFERNLKAWNEDFKAFEDEVRRSEIVTEKDLAIRINVRDDQR